MNNEKGIKMIERDSILVNTINDAIDTFRVQKRQVGKIEAAGRVDGLMTLLNELSNAHETTITLLDDNWDSNIDNEGIWEVIQYLNHINKVDDRRRAREFYNRGSK